MTASLLWIAATAALFADYESTRLIEPGGDPATGHLVNVSLDGRPVDLELPTIVFVHGLNFAPRLIHFGMADRFGEAVDGRGDPPVNLLGWNWNAATMAGLNRQANRDLAVAQGVRLARALHRLKIDPEKTHLIGQSSGTIVVASAASVLRKGTGHKLAQVTVLDPPIASHDLVFEAYDVTESAKVADHAWALGPSGLGGPYWREGLRNTQVEAPRPWAGILNPRYSAHLNVVRWYILTAADRSQPGGFNASVFAGEAGDSGSKETTAHSGEIP
ncbi:MAG: hypothetical protein AB7I30_09365 [Isosphaeraceae bacterium]